ncbi:MAG: type II toxin-antitoxin system VapC family toxin [bacterium]|nr:type II toxin-antitoxin system VapC family toxin [bacterium]MDE0217269.1 type II toxin-antitoxin system VapC family toxin [bacterium]
MILLDTHVFLWGLKDGHRIGPRTRLLLDDSLAEGNLGVSAVTFTEVARLHRKGVINLGTAPDLWHDAQLAKGLRELPVTGKIAIRGVSLMDSGFHGDPDDQTIVATAILGRHELVTADRAIQEWCARTREVQIIDPSK